MAKDKFYYIQASEPGKFDIVTMNVYASYNSDNFGIEITKEFACKLCKFGYNFSTNNNDMVEVNTGCNRTLAELADELTKFIEDSNK